MWSLLSVALSGYIGVTAQQDGNSKKSLLFKTLTCLMLMWLLVFSNEMTNARYWVVGGLLISLIAEAGYLLKKHSKFSFTALIVAQLCFSKSFWMQLSGDIIWWLPALLLGSAIVAFFLLLPKLDRLVFPVITMGIILIQLNWAAGEIWLLEASWQAGTGFLGTLCLAFAALQFAVEDYGRKVSIRRYYSAYLHLAAQALITASLII
ncbi:lysoplasmalogenase family protein [Vibrio sonorensis]|uniref:lysoplasmalogenase family protein n=1 Tax=Vibrio sonorensis TaxID=1004316 RepID=UPI0008DAC14D|nr:lysoplasmalogenase family protein [Vibrio sonorensis]